MSGNKHSIGDDCNQHGETMTHITSLYCTLTFHMNLELVEANKVI